MAYQQPPAGPFSVAEYMSSGFPFVTGSNLATPGVLRISFPFVTKFITVRNTGGGSLAFGFTENGVASGKHRMVLAPSESLVSQEIKVVDLYLTGTQGAPRVEVLAGLTGISDRNFFILTGSIVGFSGSQSNVKTFGYDGIG
jgi:hypothetical protein